MLRVRLKADGRLVEILPDGSEQAITFSQEQPRARRNNAGRVEDAAYARDVRGRRADAGGFRRTNRRSGRNGAQLGPG